jgi:hypothetical protein
VVGSQNWQTPGSSTPGPSFGHNLCFRCSNEQCEPILDIYASRAFHWYKERQNPLRFDPSNRSLKFWESTGTPSPKAGVALGVWGFTPSRFPTLPGVPDVTPGLPFGPHPCNPFALVASPKLGLRHIKTPTPKVGAHLGVWRFIPSHFLTLLGAWNVIPGLHSWSAPSQALALVASPRLGLQ